MGDPLASSWAKLDRAKEHTKALKSQIAEATDVQKHPVAFYREFEPEPTIKVAGKKVYRVAFTIVSLPMFTSDHAVLLGDALHNFRSSLDHLAWTLVKKLGQRKLSAEDQQAVQFPFARSSGSYWRQVEKRQPPRLPGVPRSPYLTCIERYQPYHRSPIGRTMRSLGNLSNTDKQRSIIPGVSLMGRGSLAIEVRGCERVGPIELIDMTATSVSGERLVRPLKLGTDIASVVVAIGPGDEPDVRMKGRITVAPILQGTWNHASFQLDLISAACTEILSEFEALL